MIKEFTKNFPDYLKTGVKGARETLLGIEKDLKEGYEKISSQAPDRRDLAKRFNKLQKRATENFSKAFNVNLEKAYNMLKLPTKSEVDEISKKVNKINQEIRKMVDVRVKSNHRVNRPKVAAKRTTSRRAARA